MFMIFVILFYGNFLYKPIRNQNNSYPVPDHWFSSIRLLEQADKHIGKVIFCLKGLLQKIRKLARVLNKNLLHCKDEDYLSLYNFERYYLIFFGHCPIIFGYYPSIFGYYPSIFGYNPSIFGYYPIMNYLWFLSNYIWWAKVTTVPNRTRDQGDR